MTTPYYYADDAVTLDAAGRGVLVWEAQPRHDRRAGMHRGWSA